MVDSFYCFVKSNRRTVNIVWHCATLWGHSIKISSANWLNTLNGMTQVPFTTSLSISSRIYRQRSALNKRKSSELVPKPPLPPSPKKKFVSKKRFESNLLSCFRHRSVTCNLEDKCFASRTLHRSAPSLNSSPQRNLKGVKICDWDKLSLI